MTLQAPTGGAFILDQPDEIPAIWGEGSQVLMSEGEALLIVASPGVGKTTLAGQLVLRRAGKGGRKRWIPVLDELQPVWEQLARLDDNAHILPKSKWGGYGDNIFLREDHLQGMSSQTVQRTVHRLAARAGISAHITPHSLRHAFADHVARFAGLKNAQQMLGHADVGTTQGYVGKVTLGELAEAIRGLRFTPWIWV